MFHLAIQLSVSIVCFHFHQKSLHPRQTVHVASGVLERGFCELLNSELRDILFSTPKLYSGKVTAVTGHMICWQVLLKKS